MKPIAVLKSIFLITAIAAVITACKKSEVPAEKHVYTLNSTWYERLPDSKVTPRVLDIRQDSVYLVYRDYGGTGSNREAQISGTIKVKDDSLLTSFKRISVYNRANQTITRSAFTGTFFQNATYILDKNTLTIKFTGKNGATFVDSTATFSRFLPDIVYY